MPTGFGNTEIIMAFTKQLQRTGKKRTQLKSGKEAGVRGKENDGNIDKFFCERAQKGSGG